MALQKSVLPVLIRGLNTSRDPKLGVPGELALLENMRMRRTAEGGGELGKRFGWTSLTRDILGGGALSSGKLLAAYEDELLQIDADAKLYSYSSTSGSWVTAGRALIPGSPASATAAGVSVVDAKDVSYNPTTNVYSSDCAVASGVVFNFYDEDGGLVVRGMDATTGRQIFVSAGLGVSKPRCAASSTRAFVVGAAGGGALHGAYYTSSGTETTVTNIVTDASANAHFDLWRDATSGKIFLAYNAAAGGTKLKILNESLAVTATTTLHASSGSAAIGWLHHDGSDSKGYLAVATATAVRCIDVSTSTGAALADTACFSENDTRNLTGYRSGSTSTVYAELLASGGNAWNARVVYGTSGGGSATTLLRSVGLASRAFKVGSLYYVLLAYQGQTSSYQNTILLKRLDDLTTGRVHGAFLSGIARGLTYYASCLGNVAAVSSTRSQVAVTALNRQGTVTYGAVRAVTLDFDALSQAKTIEFQGSLCFPGAMPQMYDGALYPTGFPTFPEVTLGSGVGAGTLAAGVYGWCAVFARMDSRGRICRSAPSIMVSATQGANTSRVINVSSQRLGTVDYSHIEIYRTPADGDGSVLYRCEAGTVANNSATDTVTFTDTGAITGEVLYSTTENGVLPNDAPPPARFLAQWGNYVVIGGTENPREFWVSKPYRDGFGLSFSGDLRGFVDDDITALASMDDKVIIFTRSSIFSLSGEGPNDIGQGMPTAQLVRTGDGTENARSVATTPNGVMFENTRGGIYLLDRSMAVSYAGAAVEEYSDLTITAAVVRRDLAQVHFLTSEGRSLVWDWEFQQWGTHTNHAGVDATVWRGSFVHLTSDGYARQQVEDQFDDDGAVITSSLKLTWLSPFGLQGHGRVYGIQILGSWRGAHQLQAQLAYDFKTTIAETLRANAPYAGLYGDWSAYGEEDVYGLGEGVYRMEIRPQYQKCTSLEIRLDDVITTASEGFRLSAISLEIGTKAGMGPTQSNWRMPTV